MQKKCNINGEIVPDEYGWLYDYFQIPCAYPKQIRETLKDMGSGDELVLEINSVGGSVFAGFEIYSLLRGAGCKTVANVQSLAASAASTIMVGCEEVLLSPVSQVMIHQPATVTAGNISEHKDSVKFLEAIEESILNGYVARCGSARRKKLKALMDAESWLTAEDAIGLGLADGLWTGDGVEVVATDAALCAGGVTNGLGLHDPAELLKKYENAVRNGAAPVEGHAVAEMHEAPAMDAVPTAVNASGNTPEEQKDEEPETVEVSAGLEPWQMAGLVEIERQRR